MYLKLKYSYLFFKLKKENYLVKMNCYLISKLKKNNTFLFFLNYAYILFY